MHNNNSVPFLDITAWLGEGLCAATILNRLMQNEGPDASSVSLDDAQTAFFQKVQNMLAPDEASAAQRLVITKLLSGAPLDETNIQTLWAALTQYAEQSAQYAAKSVLAQESSGNLAPLLLHQEGTLQKEIARTLFILWQNLGPAMASAMAPEQDHAKAPQPPSPA